MSAEIGRLELYAWAVCFALQVGLLGLLISRRNYARFPAFTVYLAGSVAQNIAQFFVYKYWGFSSEFAQEAAWGLETAVVLLRIAAILELCRQMFANYRGIWAFIWRTLLITAAVVAVLAMTLSARGFVYGILYADRAVGLSQSVAVVALLAFARYYRVQLEEPIRSLLIGFFLYSFCEVVNQTVLEVLSYAYTGVWNFLGTVSFISSVLVWGWALRKTAAQTAAAPEMLPASVYRTLSPEVNRRLSVLNDRLSQVSKGLPKGQEERP